MSSAWLKRIEININFLLRPQRALSIPRYDEAVSRVVFSGEAIDRKLPMHIHHVCTVMLKWELCKSPPLENCCESHNLSSWMCHSLMILFSPSKSPEVSIICSFRSPNTFSALNLNKPSDFPKICKSTTAKTACPKITQLTLWQFSLWWGRLKQNEDNDISSEKGS